MDEVTIKTIITLTRVSGPSREAEDLLDYFAAEIGERNGAKPALEFELHGEDDGEPSLYRVTEVDG